MSCHVCDGWRHRWYVLCVTHGDAPSRLYFWCMMQVWQQEKWDFSVMLLFGFRWAFLCIRLTHRVETMNLGLDKLWNCTATSLQHHEQLFSSRISVVNLLEQQVAVTLPFLAPHCVNSKDCQEPNWSSCSLQAVSLDVFEEGAAAQSSEEHQTEAAATAPTRSGRDSLINGVAG